MSGEVVKFPIGRVVREHRVGRFDPATESEAINQALVSMRRAIKTLRHQEATLNLRYWAARKRQMPEERARIGERNMQHIHARMAEDEANTATESQGDDTAA